MDVLNPAEHGDGRPEAAGPGAVRIYLVDGSPITRMGIHAIIESARGLEIVGFAHGGIDAEAVQELDPDVIVVNSLSLSPQRLGSIARLSGRSSHAPQRILMIVGEQENAAARRARAGADGSILLQARPEEFVAAINLVAAGYSVDVPSADAAAPQSGPDSAGGLGAVGGAQGAGGAESRPARTPRWSTVKALTRRELDVLRAVAQGRTNAEIARMMTVSESTVKSHVQNLLTKLGLPNRASAVAVAYEAGVLSGGC